MTFLLSDIENAVRQDLFDPAGASQRWATSDIDRAIDKAVYRYSTYYPNIVYNDLASEPFQRTYPYPASWNSSYPVLWIERILYPYLFSALLSCLSGEQRACIQELACILLYNTTRIRPICSMLLLSNVLSGLSV